MKKASMNIGSQFDLNLFLQILVLALLLLIFTGNSEAARIYNHTGGDVKVCTTGIISGSTCINIADGTKSKSLSWEHTTGLNVMKNGKLHCRMDFGLKAQIQGGNYMQIKNNSCIVYNASNASIAQESHSGYPLAKITNHTNTTISAGQVEYASVFCENDNFSNLAPGKTWSAKSRGVCLITGIKSLVAVDSHGKVVTIAPYSSTGTSFSGFHLVERFGKLGFYSDNEVKTGALDYPSVSLKNNTQFTATGTIKYLSPLGISCTNDNYTVEPGETIKGDARGLCLITHITAKLKGTPKYGESNNVVQYDSSGTSYSKFQITAYGGSYKVFSESQYAEATDITQSKSPGFFLVNKTPWAVSYRFSQGVGCTNHGIVPASSNGKDGIYKVSKVVAVWYKMKLQVQPDGIDPTDSFKDCALPVAELVADVAWSVFTGGSGAAINTALKTSATLAAKEAAKEAAKVATKEIIKKAIEDYSKEQLGKLFSKGTNVELEGQYAGYDWPFRCNKMPEYHITGGPLVFEENGKRYLSRGKPFTVTKVNTCGDDMQPASDKQAVADQGVFAGLELGGIQAIDVAEVFTGGSENGGIEQAFKHVPSSSIPGFNNKTLNNKTRKQCMSACVNETGFVCNSFDYYNKTKQCSLSTASGTQKPNDGSYDYYELKFKTLRNNAISGHNTKTLGSKSRSECIEECANTPWCKSVEYKKPNKICNLSKVSGPPSANGEFDLFIRK